VNIIPVIEKDGERYISVRDFQEWSHQNTVMREALNWSKEFFLNRDRMNAKVHCAPLRLSPITERVILSLGESLDDFKS